VTHELKIISIEFLQKESNLSKIRIQIAALSYYKQLLNKSLQIRIQKIFPESINQVD